MLLTLIPGQPSSASFSTMCACWMLFRSIVLTVSRISGGRRAILPLRAESDDFSEKGSGGSPAALMLRSSFEESAGRAAWAGFCEDSWFTHPFVIWLPWAGSIGPEFVADA